MSGRGMGMGSSAGQEGELLPPQPPGRPLELWEAYELLFTTIKKFMDKYTTCHLVWRRPERGYSSMHIKLISKKAKLYISSQQKTEKTETITIELVHGEGRKDVRVMDVRSTGMLGSIWNDMMWYELQLYKKYCYHRFERQEGFLIDGYTICLVPWELHDIC